MVKYDKFKMTDDEHEEFKHDLAHCELKKDESDLNVFEFEELLSKKIPTKLLEDDIKEIEKQLREKFVLNVHNIEIDLTEADILKRKITLEKLKKTLKLGIPERQLRLKLNVLKHAKKKIDAPERQISKLKKNIRDKAFYRLAQEKKTMPGVD